MKNHVILLAGGVGQRMHSDIPKQFIKVNDKPIIAYTIENFQKNTSVETITIVCVKDWIGYLKELIKSYDYTKVRWIIEGGATGHDSIKNGVFFLKDKIDLNDYVIIHDAVRPILPQNILTDVLNVAHKNGNAASSIVCHPPIVYTEDFKSGNSDIDRDHVMLTASPQVYKYSLVFECYKKAEIEGKNDFTFTSSLLIYYGYSIYFAKGTTLNIKITTSEDIALFKALLSIPLDSKDSD